MEEIVYFLEDPVTLRVKIDCAANQQELRSILVVVGDIPSFRRA